MGPRGGEHGAPLRAVGSIGHLPVPSRRERLWRVKGGPPNNVDAGRRPAPNSEGRSPDAPARAPRSPPPRVARLPTILSSPTAT